MPKKPEREVSLDDFTDVVECGSSKASDTGKMSPTIVKYVQCNEVGNLDDNDDGLDPEENCVSIKANVNLYKCAFNILKGNVGTAVFLLPSFYKDAGYVVSPIIGFMMGSFVVDCSCLLLRAKRIVNRKNVSDYLQVCEFVLGKPFRYILLVALLLTQFGFCLFYLQLFGNSMSNLAPRFSGNEYVWMTVMFVLVVPVTLFSDKLSFLALISIVAIVCVFFALISTAVLTFVELRIEGVNPNTHPVGTAIPFGWFNNMANNMMLLEGIGVVLPVENSCSDKRRFPHMVTIVLYLVVGWYLLYGLTGYLAYGEALEISVVDTLPKSTLSVVVRVAYNVNIVCTYPILFMPGILQLDSLLGWRSRSWKGILMRIVIGLIIYGIAMGIGTETVGTVVSLIGALPATVMVLILPPLLSLSVDTSVEEPDVSRSTLKYWRYNLFGRPCSFIRVRSYFYICCGILIMVVGTYSILSTIVT